MTLLDDITTAEQGRQVVWPPEGHRERIAQQRRFQVLGRNNRGQMAAAYREELAAQLELADSAQPLMPAPKMASRIMASFLFGEPPRISFDAQGANDQLAEWREETAADTVLREGARTCSVQGEVYLRPVWDSELSPHPLLTVVAGRRVIPRWRHRILTEAVIWSEASVNQAEVWRLLEYHAPEGIELAVYRGTSDTLGRRQPWGSGPAGWRDLEEYTETRIQELTLVHVPFDRDSDDPHGISMFDGTEGLALGLHRLYLQEQHDAEMVRRRIAVPSDYLQRDPRGGIRFDRDSDVMELTESAAGPVGSPAPIQPIEFSNDLVDRERIQGRIRDFMLACGIAPQTLGEEAGQAESGTARKLAQALTIQTVALAGGYWVTALRRAIPLTLRLGAIHLGNGVADAEAPTVTLQDGFVEDPVETARIVATLEAADSMSVEARVEALHPDWTEEAKAEEVARLRRDTSRDPASLGEPRGLADLA